MDTTTLDPTPEVRAAARPFLYWAPLAVLMAGTFIFVLDFFIINVALPAISTDLDAGDGAIEWIVAGYALTSAAGFITAGRLGDIYGRRRLFTIGVGIFVAASALCALAVNPEMLVAARLAQGAGAAAMAPNILSLMGVLYTGAAQTRAISIYGMVMGLAAVAGQIVGGLLIRADIAGLDWRAVFWINVPIGLVALVLAPRLMPESRAESGSGRLDVRGVGLITAALVALLLPLIEGRESGWPAWSWMCLAAAPILLTAFVFQQRRTAERRGDALLDPRIFVGPLRAGLATQLMFWVQQAAGYTFLALYLQQGRGMTPLGSGAVFAVLAAGYLLTSLRAPELTIRYGRTIILIGASVAAMADLLLAATVGHIEIGGSVGLLFPGLFLLGAGQGLCITPLTTTVLGQARPETAGAVSGALSTIQQAGNAIGVAGIGVVFYAHADRAPASAMEWTAITMAGTLAVVAVLTRMLPKVSR
ncbi:MFS transporter [Jongsikchunia kroppenstedtii]|uniref:MFS transporter n=1 Tax=Jongsikchunia kroppenstedtii TaxID=1121721 RepID=UPI00036D734B|nr:MFS transporter [Jongsikchunia kroppenstedtii]